MQIKTWQQLNPALLEFAKLDVEVNHAEAKLDEQFQKLRHAHAKRVSRKNERLATLHRSIQTFCKSNKAEFDGARHGASSTGAARSRKINGMVFGFRLSNPSVHIQRKKIEEVIKWLKRKFVPDYYVRVTEEPNREALRQALIEGDDRFRKLCKDHGITLKQKDEFFLDTEA